MTFDDEVDELAEKYDIAMYGGWWATSVEIGEPPVSASFERARKFLLERDRRREEAVSHT